MDTLKQRMKMDMELRGLSPRTQEAYLKQMHQYVRYFKKSPLNMGENEIREYLHYLGNDRGLSHSYVNTAYSALKFFYCTTAGWDWDIRKIPRMKKQKKLPVVLSPDEVSNLFSVTTNIKHKVILMTIYSAGLRVSEAAHLRVIDIDSRRMQIHVQEGKGNKERYCILSKIALISLRKYWCIYKPSYWLFESVDPNKPLSTRSIQKIFKGAMKKSGNKKIASVHSLRHSFATHLLELDTDVYSIQKLMGHRSVKTTSIYIHVQEQKALKIVSPLDRIMESANA